MKLPRRTLLALTVAAAGLTSLTWTGAANAAGLGGPGHVYTMSNAAAGNQVLAYSVAGSGQMILLQTVATQGLGSGAGLGSQGAVTLSQDGHFLFVVNPGSNTLSTFNVKPTGLKLVSSVDTGGLHPISVSEYAGVVYVLNDGGDGNVSGFANRNGHLTALTDGIRPLSAAGGTGPAEVSFDKLGGTLVVSEKNTNLLTTYAVSSDGTLSAPQTAASSGATPFGFVFDINNRLLVTEAAGGAALASTFSSYRFAPSAPQTPKLVSASLATGQTAACWAAATPDGRYAFTANTGSGSISSFAVSAGGRLALQQSVAALTPGAAAADLAVAPTGQRLFVRNGAVYNIGAFAIGPKGTLTALGTVAIPTTAQGLAAD
jgi:6-phosphogluconolactonase (cycloisomerase 2 family)